MVEVVVPRTVKKGSVSVEKTVVVVLKVSVFCWPTPLVMTVVEYTVDVNFTGAGVTVVDGVLVTFATADRVVVETCVEVGTGLTEFGPC